MVVRSPYADVDIPDVGLPEFLFGDLSDADAARVAIIDGSSGAQTTFGELAGAIDRFAAALGERGLGRGDVIALFAPNNAYYPVVFHGALAAGVAVTTVNSLYTPDELAFQLRDSGAKMLVTITPVPRPGPRRDGAGRRRRHRDRPHRRHPRRRRHPAARERARRPALDHGRAPAGDGDRRRRRRTALLLGDHRAREGRGADPPQPRGEPGPVPGAQREHRRRLEDPRGAAVLPHLRHDRDDEPRHLRAGDRRDDAEVRSRRVPADHLRVPRRPRLHRPADRRRAGQAPDGRPVRHRLRRHRVLRGRRARRRARARRREAPELHRAAGLRDDRAQPGQPRDAAGPSRHGPQLDRRRAAQHRVQARRPRDRRGGLARRAVGPRSRTSCASTSTTPRPPRRPSTPTASCTPATSPPSPTRASSTSSTASRN